MRRGRNHVDQQWPQCIPAGVLERSRHVKSTGGRRMGKSAWGLKEATLLRELVMVKILSIIGYRSSGVC